MISELLRVTFIFSMHSKIYEVVVFVDLISIFGSVISDLIVIPHDTEVPLNRTTYLNCTTSTKTLEVAWYHYKAGDPYRRHNVYDGGMIEHSYGDRFRIEGDKAKGEFNLVIESVQGHDAGRYECQDEEGMGSTSSAHLVVLEEGLQCLSDANEEGLVGPNDCGITPDTVHLSCRVRFHGDKSPTLDWGLKRGDTSNTSGDSVCRTENNEHICNLTINVNDLRWDETSFVCKTSRVQSGAQSSCTTKPFKITYAIEGQTQQTKVIGEKVKCVANSSQPCQYRWSQMKDNEMVHISSDATFTPRVTGLYKCQAECRLRNEVCTVNSLTIGVIPSAQTSSESNDGVLKIALIVTVVIIALQAILMAICFLCCLRAIKKKKHQKSYPVSLESVHVSDNNRIYHHHKGNHTEESRLNHGNDRLSKNNKQSDNYQMLMSNTADANVIQRLESELNREREEKKRLQKQLNEFYSHKEQEESFLERLKPEP